MNTEEHGRPGEEVDAPPVKLQAVVPTISAPVLHDPSSDPPPGNEEQPGTEGPLTREPVMVLTIDVPWAGIPRPPVRRVDLELAGAVAMTTMLDTVDVRSGVVAGLLVCAFASLMRISRRIPFSFGQGFIGYRSDMAWPQGVQEDDDFRWNWKPRANGQTQ